MIKKNHNVFQLTKNKTDLYKREMKNHPPSSNELRQKRDALLPDEKQIFSVAIVNMELVYEYSPELLGNRKNKMI